MHFSTSSARRLRLALVHAGVCAALALAPALAEPLLFDPAMPDPRTTGELPPGQAAPATPLKPSFELPGGGLWLRGELPSGAADPDHPLRGARAEAGVRLRLFTGAGFGWGVTPTLAGAGAPSSAAGTEPSLASPHVGFALGQDLSLSLPFGLRLGVEGAVGDRLAVGGLSTSTAPVSSDLAMRAGVTLSTDLALPVLQTPLRLGLGLATAGTLPDIGLGFATAGALPGAPARGAAGRRWYDADDCRVSLEIGRVGGAPLRVSSGCLVTPGAVPPVTVGFRTEF